MLKQENGQRDIYSDLLNQIVRADHSYRKVLEIVDFTRNFLIKDKQMPFVVKDAGANILYDTAQVPLQVRV